MEALAALVAQHGYPLLALFVFLEAIGAPVPAAIALLIAGSSSAHGPLYLGSVILTGIAAMLTGDILMFALGRLTGWWLLGALCRLSLNPDSCVVRSADSFYKRGRSILLVCKFLPGINTMATPLAGSMNMPVRQFLPLDFAGVTFYISVYAAAGYIFSDSLALMQRGYSNFGTFIGWVIGLAFLGWLTRRLRVLWNSRKAEPVDMVLPSEIGCKPGFTILDVRSHGYYDGKSVRIKGSTRLEPNALGGQITLLKESLGPGDEIILYCTCLNEATAVQVAREMKRMGLNPKVLSGGLKAWRKAGLPLEPVPADEVVLLPKFA